MSFLSNLKETHIRGLLALILVLAVVIGFFTGIVPLEMFTSVVSAMLMYYFQGERIVKLEKEKEEAVAQAQAVLVEIQSLKH